MKKRLITMPKRILAVLAIIGFMLFSTGPMAAFATTESSVAIVPNGGDPSSGKLVLDVADEQIHLDLYFIAPGTTVEVRQNARPLIVLGPMTGFVPPPPFEFNGLAPGTTVKACIRIAATTIVRCDTYVVPGVTAPVDTDKDGVADDKDGCPNAAGPATNGGCPLPVDTDKDGVSDDQDKCPNVVGPASNGGCPLPVDTDGDGLTDDKDGCINAAGPASNNGCPLPPADTDKDGVTDDKDKCVDVAGPASNNGCPEVVSPKKAAVCKYVGKPGVDERLQTGQNPIVVDRKDWMVIGSPFQDAQGRSIVIAFLNPQDPEPSVDQCPAPVVDVCPDMPGDQPAGTDCNPVVTPVTCPPGMGWKDANDNGKIDEGECVKRTPPGSGPPADTPPVGTPPVDAPPVDVETPVVPVKVEVDTSVEVETSVEVDTTVEEVVVISEGDETNGRGVTAETAAVESGSLESAVSGSQPKLAIGLLGFAILLVTLVWQFRPSASE